MNKFVALNREVNFLEYDGVSFRYRKPNVVQTPYMICWLSEGFLNALPRKAVEIIGVESLKQSVASVAGTNPEKTVQLLKEIKEELKKSNLPVIKAEDTEPKTSIEKLNHVITRIKELYNSKEHDFNEIMGAAMIGSEASIKYLYPVFSQSFPDLSIFELRDDVFNFCMGTMLNDYFTELLNTTATEE